MKPLWLLSHCVDSHLSNEMYSPKKEELGNTSLSPRALTSVTAILVYHIYFVYLAWLLACHIGKFTVVAYLENSPLVSSLI